MSGGYDIDQAHLFYGDSKGAVLIEVLIDCVVILSLQMLSRNYLLIRYFAIHTRCLYPPVDLCISLTKLVHTGLQD